MKLVLLTFMCVLTAEAFAQPQISGFTYIGELNQHRYYVSQYTASWLAADSTCRSKGGRLACIGSQSENDLLWVYVGVHSDAWIGFTDEVVEGDWRWASGEPVTYTRWTGGQPDNSGGDQNYACLQQYNGQWDDLQESFLLYFTLEIVPCPPTTLPFVDNFASPTLDSCWSWVREDTSHWSLTARPGWLRIVCQDWGGGWGAAPNLLFRRVENEPLIVSTLISFDPSTGGQQNAGLMLQQDWNNFLYLTRHFDAGLGGQILNLQIVDDGNFTWEVLPCTDTLMYLRFVHVANTWLASFSADSVNWTHFSPVQDALTGAQTLDAGCIGLTVNSSPPEIPVDFEYFRVDPLPGTNVCGNVSGVWDLAHSPYYVNCDVTVPAGQTLTIEPGVQVLFTGSYSFTVNGALSALGTSEDSILFSGTDAAGSIRWNGISILTQVPCSLSYCCVQWSGNYGVTMDHAAVSFLHCRIVHNEGGLAAGYTQTNISDCVFENNVNSVNEGGGGNWWHSTGTIVRTCFLGNSSSHGGALIIGNSSTPSFTECLIAGNSSAEASGAFIEEGASPIFQNCTFAQNTTPYHGCIHVWGATMTMNSCIMAFSNGPSITTDGGSALVSYSDIQGGYAGTGNINLDPLFVDALNGDFHLQSASPCIDAGDPASPLDPDSTITDMGAFYYPQSPLLFVSPLEMNFGLQDIGADSVAQISLYNPGGVPTIVSEISHTVTAFIVDTSGLNGQVSPNSTYNVHVTFAPSVAGSYYDELVIVAERAGDDTLVIPLYGEAQVLAVAPESLVVKRGTGNNINLHWNPVTETISGQPLPNPLYHVHASSSESGPFLEIGVSDSTGFVHSGIIGGPARYFYRVTASAQ